MKALIKKEAKTFGERSSGSVPGKYRDQEPEEEIVYPESDGKPMADNTKHYRWIVKIKEGIEILFADSPDVFVAADMFWYPVEKKNRIRTAPDVMVAFGRPKGDRGSYLQWKEGNIAPQAVFEIIASENARCKMDRKFRFYERHGVEEYYAYDVDKVEFRGWTRSGKRLVPIKDTQGWISPRLKIRFEIASGELVVICPDGEKFLTAQGIYRRAEQVMKKAKAYDKIAEAENEIKQADAEIKKILEAG